MRTLQRGFVGLALPSLLTLGCGQPAPDGDEPGGSSGSEATADATTGGSPGATSTGSAGATEGSTGPEQSTSGETTGDPAGFVAGDDALVALFEDAHVFWLGWDDGQNQRQVDVEVDLPEPGFTYGAVVLTLRLSCPEGGGCDWWDRKGSLGLVADPSAEDSPVWELVRFMTPYRVGGTWSLDVTALQPLLQGRQTLRVYIDTWVGPGHANGDGWIVDAQLEYTGGVPDEVPTQVIPLWPGQELTIGDPMNPLAEQLGPAALEVPPQARRVELWSVITGHGQGNLDNCAEFCQLAHGFLVGESPVQQTIWRDDCDQNPIQGQQGTWTLPRAGWCPGDVVQPWVQDVTAQAPPGTTVQVQYAAEDYENSCRPDAPVCTGCALGTGCEYDGGNHTPPTVYVSSAAVIYEAGQ